jgi:hypothetical protein
MGLNSPNAGATWQVGASQTVSWSATGNTSSISYFVVMLSTNGGGSYSAISSNLSSSSRSFSYTPNSGQASTSAVVWVKAFDSGNNFLAGAISSGDFIIANPTPTIAVTNPSVGTAWQGGTAYTISWSVSGNTSSVYGYTVYLSSNNGGSYAFIGDTVGASSQSLSYTPNNSQATTSAVIWVKAIDSNSNVIASGFTNGTFTIAAVAPTINVTSPAGGSTWQAGTAYTINWSVNGDTSNVYGYVVYLSINNGGSYSFIGDTVGASSQSLSFAPNNGQSTTSAVIWVKAIDSNSNVVASGFTTETFAISAGASVAVSGDGQDIANGETSPSTADGSDFGAVLQGSLSIFHSFTITNTGSATLTLGNVTVPSGFSLVNAPATSIAPNSSTSFTVALDQANTGTSSGDVSFATNDSANSTFRFTVTGTVSAPEGTGLEQLTDAIYGLQTAMTSYQNQEVNVLASADVALVQQIAANSSLEGVARSMAQEELNVAAALLVSAMEPTEELEQEANKLVSDLADSLADDLVQNTGQWIFNSLSEWIATGNIQNSTSYPGGPLQYIKDELNQQLSNYILNNNSAEALISMLPASLPESFPLTSVVNALNGLTQQIVNLTPQSLSVPLEKEVEWSLPGVGLVPPFWLGTPSEEARNLTWAAGALGTTSTVSAYVADALTGWLAGGAAVKLVVSLTGVGAPPAEALYFGIAGVLGDIGTFSGLANIAFNGYALYEQFTALDSLRADMQQIYNMFQSIGNEIVSEAESPQTPYSTNFVVDGTLNVPNVTAGWLDGQAHDTVAVQITNDGSISGEAEGILDIYRADSNGNLDLVERVPSDKVIAIAPGNPQSLTFTDFNVPDASLFLGSYYFATCTIDDTAGVKVMGDSFQASSVLAGAVDSLGQAIINGTITAGQTLGTWVNAASNAVEEEFDLNYPGSDMDLQVYDSAGDLVGYDYATGEIDLGIPGAEYFPASAGLPQRIEVPVSPATQLYVQVVASQTAGPESVGVDMNSFVEHAPTLSTSPNEIVASASPGGDANFNLTLAEIGDQQDLTGVGVTISNLLGPNGTVIPASDITFTDPPSTIGAGSQDGVSFQLTAPLAAGAYQGSVLVTSDDGTSTVPVELDVAVPGVLAGSGAQYTVSGPIGSQILDVSSGTIALDGDLSSILSDNYTLKIENGAAVLLESDQNVGQLEIIGDGTLDLSNNELLINYGTNPDPKSAIWQSLASGYDGGRWTGPGIDSSAASLTKGAYGVGFADGADGVVAGLNSGQIELKYTLNGDTNLDGKVNGADLTILATNFNQSVTNGWDKGDFNYDGKVNGADLLLLADNFNQGVNLNAAGLVPSIGAQYTITGSPGAQILDIFDGTVTLTSDLSALLPNYSLQIENGATVVLASDQHVGALQLVGSGSLDVSNYRMFINYGSNPDPITTIAGSIKSGYSGGAWNGTGIFSSAAAVNNKSYGLGYADSADAGNPAGLSSGQIEIKYTLLGDANLDGKVNGADFTIVANHFSNSVTAGWDRGDFNYDGEVNGADFLLLAANFEQSASQSAVSSADLAVNSNNSASGSSAAFSAADPSVSALTSTTVETKQRKPHHHLG